MALHPHFPPSPYEILPPDLRWFPAAEELRSTAYEKLLPPLVAKVRREVKAWRDADFRAFEVLNLGRYERQAYLNVGGRLTGVQKAQALAQKESEFRELILRTYKAIFGNETMTLVPVNVG